MIISRLARPRSGALPPSSCPITDMADPESRSRARLCCAYPRGPSARWISDGSDGLAFIRWGNSSMMMSPSPTSPNSRCSASSQSANAYRPPPVRSRLTRARPKLSSESISVESVGLVVHHDHGEVGQADGARVDDRLAVAALVQFRVAHQHEHPRRHKPAGDQPVRDADPSGRPCPSDPLAISTPGLRLRSGWYPSREEAEPNCASHDSGMNPLAASTA